MNPLFFGQAGQAGQLSAISRALVCNAVSLRYGYVLDHYEPQWLDRQLQRLAARIGKASVTDFDPLALAIAQRGVYSETQIQLLVASLQGSGFLGLGNSEYIGDSRACRLRPWSESNAVYKKHCVELHAVSSRP